MACRTLAGAASPGWVEAAAPRCRRRQQQRRRRREEAGGAGSGVPPAPGGPPAPGEPAPYQGPEDAERSHRSPPAPGVPATAVLHTRQPN